MEKWIEKRENYKQAFERRRAHKWLNSREDDPRSTEELIRLALAEADEDSRWDLVAILQLRDSPEVTERAVRLSRSVESNERILAAEILAQNAMANKKANEVAVTTLIGMLGGESNVDVLSSVAMALGYRDDPRVIGPLLPLVKHPDSDVRYGVVHGLRGHEDKRAIAALIELTADDDRDVRDWATFGLGTSLDTNTRAIREALWARVTDLDIDTRHEALYGLAVRGDKRVVEPLVQEFEREWPNLTWRMDEAVLEAGNHFSDQRLYRALMLLWANEEYPYTRNRLAAALDRLGKLSTKEIDKK